MISRNNFSNFNPQFKAYKHTIQYNNSRINRGDTCLFRFDLPFNDFVKFIYNKYKNVDKVEVIAHACSDGEEIFSVVSKMIDMLKNNAEKFLPIKAYDLEKEHILRAEKSNYTIESYERDAIKYYLGNNFFNYFLQEAPNNIIAKNILKSKVHFSQSNIMDDIQHIGLHNTVLLARNFWHYLTKKDIDKLAITLGKKMDESSTLVIGDYDKEYNIDKILNKNGIYETDVENVFEKKKLYSKPNYFLFTLH